MPSIEAEYKSKVPQFLRKYNTGKDKTLEQIGSTGVINIDQETPVLSGELLGGNEFKVVGDDVLFYNDVDYASYVELGTVNQSANPFMRRGLAKSQASFLNIAIKNFKV